MPKLTATELEEHRDWLSDWRGPAELAAYVDAVNENEVG